jgi:hypothetical protein
MLAIRFCQGGDFGSGGYRQGFSATKYFVEMNE